MTLDNVNILVCILLTSLRQLVSFLCLQTRLHGNIDPPDSHEYGYSCQPGSSVLQIKRGKDLVWKAKAMWWTSLSKLYKDCWWLWWISLLDRWYFLVMCVWKFWLWDPILMIGWTLNRSLSRTSLGPLSINDEKLYEDKNSTDMKDIYFKGFFKTAAFSHL